MRATTILLAVLLAACGGDPLADVFSEHESTLDECITYRLNAEDKAAAAAAAKKKTLGGGAARIDAQNDEAVARTLHRTHEACLVRLLESADRSAEGHGLTPESLRERWPAWYESKVAARREAK